jgi:hypothetical protein
MRWPLQKQNHARFHGIVNDNVYEVCLRSNVSPYAALELARWNWNHEKLALTSADFRKLLVEDLPPKYAGEAPLVGTAA